MVILSGKEVDPNEKREKQKKLAAELNAQIEAKNKRLALCDTKQYN